MTKHLSIVVILVGLPLLDLRPLAAQEGWGGAKGSISALGFSPDGKFAVVGYTTGAISVWELGSGRSRTYPPPERYEEVHAVAFSPDGKLILAADGGGLVRLLDRPSGKSVRNSRQKGGVYSASFSADSRLLLTGGSEGMILWEVATGKRLRTFPDLGETSAYVALSPDGRLALSGGWPFVRSEEEVEGLRWVKVWDVGSGRLIHRSRLEGTVSCLGFTPDGKCALAGSTGGDTKVWCVATWGECCTFRQKSPVSAATFTLGGRFVLIASYPPGVSLKRAIPPRLWEVATGQMVRELEVSEEGAWWKRAILSPDARLVLGAGNDRLTVWDGRRGQEIRTLEGRYDAGPAIIAVAFTPDDKALVAVDASCRVTCWDVATGTLRRVIARGHGRSYLVEDAAISADAKSVLGFSDFGCEGKLSLRLRLLDVPQRKMRVAFGDSESVRCGLAFLPNGYRAVVGGRNAELWDLTFAGLAPVKRICTLRAPDGACAAYISISPDGTRAACWSDKDAPRIWHLGTGSLIRCLKTGVVNAVGFLPSNRAVVTLGTKTGMALWDTDHGKLLKQFVIGKGVEMPQVLATGRTALGISPDGRWALTEGTVSDLLLWDLRSGTQTCRFVGKGVPRGTNAIAFSHSGKWVVTGGCGQRLKLWDLATGRQLRRFQARAPGQGLTE